MKILSCSNVSKNYFDDKNKITVEALKDITLSVDKGEIVTLIGPSGCGKSTLLHLMGGFLKPDEGEIVFNEKVVNKPTRELAMIFQENSLFPWLTVEQNIRLALHPLHLPHFEIEARVENALSQVKLKGFNTALPAELSGGMKQKAILARTLITNPEIILMDEPFSSLDEQTRTKLDENLISLVGERGTTVIYVTHSIEEAILLSDRIFVFSVRPGKIIEEIKVDLPKPRNIFQPAVHNLHEKLFSKIELCCATPQT